MDRHSVHHWDLNYGGRVTDFLDNRACKRLPCAYSETVDGKYDFEPTG